MLFILLRKFVLQKVTFKTHFFYLKKSFPDFDARKVEQKESHAATKTRFSVKMNVF